MTTTARIGAAAFALWGLLHLTGGGMILLALTNGPEAGYAVYGLTGTALPALTGAILGYFAYLIAAAGVTAVVVAARWNWNNSAAGLAANTTLVLAVEAGLIGFLLIPGHVALLEALPGFVLATAGIVLGGKACRTAGHADATV